MKPQKLSKAFMKEWLKSVKTITGGSLVMTVYKNKPPKFAFKNLKPKKKTK